MQRAIAMRRHKTTARAADAQTVCPSSIPPCFTWKAVAATVLGSTTKATLRIVLCEDRSLGVEAGLYLQRANTRRQPGLAVPLNYTCTII
jgi:hypothetical protein